MFFRRQQVIGIDLGASSAKAVLLEKRAAGTAGLIREYAMLSLDASGRPLEEIVRWLTQKLRTRCRACAVSAWPTGAKLRFFDPHSEPALVKSIATGKIDASALFHEPLEDYVVQCAPVANLRGGNEGSMFVASGIPRTELNKIEKAVQKAGCELHLLQLAPVALLNAFTASQTDIGKKEPFLLVDFGRARMTIIGGIDGSVRMMRRADFPWGEIPPPLMAADAEATQDDDNGDVDEVFSAIFGDVTRLVASELRWMLESLQTQEDFVHFDEVYVSGALTNNRPVMERLRKDLEIQCKQWNPFRHLAAHNRALSDFSLLGDLAHLPSAAGAAFQHAA
jgi:Tfp pilus assembly PilM family ATPase